MSDDCYFTNMMQNQWSVPPDEGINNMIDTMIYAYNKKSSSSNSSNSRLGVSGHNGISGPNDSLPCDLFNVHSTVQSQLGSQGSVAVPHPEAFLPTTLIDTSASSSWVQPKFHQSSFHQRLDELPTVQSSASILGSTTSSSVDSSPPTSSASVENYTRVETKKTYICTYNNCNTRCARKAELQRHFRGAHAKDKSYRCRFAGCHRNSHGFSRRDKRNDHERSMHRGVGLEELS